MTKLKPLLTFLSISIFVLLTNFNAFSQLGLVVLKNERGSCIKYAFDVGNTIKEAQDNAKKMLIEQNKPVKENTIYTLDTEGKTGHELNKGYYVLILASRNIRGNIKNSYGLGGSSISNAEALKCAVIHLKENDFGYTNQQGYAIVKKGNIEDLFPSED